MEPEAALGPKAGTLAAAAGASSPPATTGSTAASPPAAAAPSAPADGSPSPTSTDSPSSEPAKPPAGEQTPQQRAAFKALSEGQAALRRGQQALEAERREYQAFREWDQKVRENPALLAERYGADIFEKGARVAAGAEPKAPDPNDRVTKLEQQIADERKQRETAQAQAQIRQSHAIVRGVLEKAADAAPDVLALGRENEVFDAYSLYLRNEGIRVHEGKYYARDGTPIADSFENALIVEIGKKVNAEIVQELGGLVEKAPSIRSRFAPAPAAVAAPAAPATPAAPPKEPAPPAREAPAPATLTGKHGSDAAPSVSNGRRKSIAEVDEEIAARFWG
jgi:hypothetical protein